MEIASPPLNDVDAMRKRVRAETPFWAENFAWIVNKQGKLVKLNPKPGQRELDARLEGQRKAGKPQRLISLKARQRGISTYAQAKLIHRCTLTEHYDALTVAHDRETASKLDRMARTIWGKLPNDPELKPELGEYRRGRFMHFAGDGDWKRGEAFPDSRYLVDTAGEFEAGRGGTYRAFHLSEVAFWPQIMQKWTALMQGIPDDPDTLIIVESTANGFNEFKDLWDDAEEGHSEFIAFFLPWYEEEEYALPFASETEREEFRVGDETQSPYAERESELVERFELTLEQLNWRRYTIANKCGGDLRIWDQEYPTTPEDAFIATGQKVFNSIAVTQMVKRVEGTDPRKANAEQPGPEVGDFQPESMTQMVNRSGNNIDVPEKARWVPRPRGVHNSSPPFRMWLPPDGIQGKEFIIGADVSGDNTETTRETDYHAIQVIDHRTREQVAEYRSRGEVEEFAELVLLTALYFNNAWIAVERTGGWGLPVIRLLRRDFHYPFMYRPRRVGSIAEGAERKYGWDTTQRTKPELIASMAALLKDEEDGIKSRLLANEVRTYTRTEKGATEAEPGKFDDLLMAYMIAQQVARERPLMGLEDQGPEEPAFVVTSEGMGSYDPRYS